ncbi:MAG: hypothetical protein ACOC7S_00935 [Planctomycetota bacterium]
MAFLTCDKKTEYSLGDLLSVPVAADTCIFGGALVAVNSHGYAIPARSRCNLLFAGVATARADNRGGRPGGKHVLVRRRGRYRLDYQGERVQQSMLGALAFAVDDQTVTTEITELMACGATDGLLDAVIVGTIDRPLVGEAECWVSIDSAVLLGRPWYMLADADKDAEDLEAAYGPRWVRDGDEPCSSGAGGGTGKQDNEEGDAA